MKLLAVLTLCAVAVGCGYGTHSTMPPAAGTTPTIMQLTPNSATAGGPAFNLMITGTNFGSKAVVNFNNTAMMTTWTNSTQVTAAIPQSAIANAGTVQVTVTNPASGGGIYGGGTAAATSAPMNFTIN
jgi:IPT/TIG domain